LALFWQEWRAKLYQERSSGSTFDCVQRKVKTSPLTVTPGALFWGGAMVAARTAFGIAPKILYE
jgi:hypothetical protein